MDRERELRRTRSTLHSLGTGVIIFGVWSILKTITLLIVTPIETYLSGEELEAYISVPVSIRIAVYAVLLMILLMVDLIPRIYIGRNAIRIGLGKKPGRLFTVLCWFLFAVWALLDLISLFFLPQAQNPATGMLDTIITFIVDVTATVIIGELCFSVRRLKKLEQGEV